MAKKVLMACTNYWTSPFQVGSHHLARQFALRGWEVAFISDPISPFHLFGGNSKDLAERFSLYLKGGIRDLGGKLWAYVPGTLMSPHNKPLLRSRWVFRHWQNLTFPSALWTVRSMGFGEVDLLYLDSVAQSFWLGPIRAKKSLFRIADNNAGFEKWTRPAREMERELAQRVDGVVYAAQSLKEVMGALKPKSLFHLPNGVNYHHFAGAEPKPPKEYGSIPQPIAIYVGAMEEWFNLRWLRSAARALPKVSFVLIGRAPMAETFKDLANVHFLGPRPYTAIPAYLRHAQVGIIPFDLKAYPKLVNNIHPLKLYEYMACGLPVVSTAWRELKNLKSPAILAENENQFSQGIQRVVSRPGNKARYRDYAKKQDWSGRVEMLLDYIGRMK